jgi:hypothetical protein
MVEYRDPELNVLTKELKKLYNEIQISEIEDVPARRVMVLLFGLTSIIAVGANYKDITCISKNELYYSVTRRLHLKRVLWQYSNLVAKKLKKAQKVYVPSAEAMNEIKKFREDIIHNVDITRKNVDIIISMRAAHG